MSDHNEKRSLLAQLIKLAKADKELKESEFQFLFSISQQLEFPSDEFQTLFEEHIAIQPPVLELDRIIQFHRLVLLMNVDEDISEKEMNLVRTTGIRMGLSPLAISEVLDVMHNYPNKMVPPDKLMSIFQTFHN